MRRITHHMLSETFSIAGLWYLPGQEPDDGVSGILEYSPDSIVLKLNGTLETTHLEEISSSAFGDPRMKTIWGFSKEGEYFTLYDCYQRNLQSSIPGYTTESYVVNSFFVGYRHVEKSELFIDRVGFSLTHLTAWLRPNIIKEKFEDGKRSIFIDSSAFQDHTKTTQIPSVKLNLVERASCVNADPPSGQGVITEDRHIQSYSYYLMHSDDNSPLLFRSWIDDIHAMRRLFSALTGFPMLFLFIDIRCVSGVIRTDEDEDIVTPGWCRFFWNQVGRFDLRRRISPIQRDSALFFKQDLDDRFSLVLDQWFNLRTEFSTTIYPFIADMNLPAYATNRFLSAVQSLEACHRFFVEPKHFTPKAIPDPQYERDHDAVVNFIIAHVSKKNQNSFLERFRAEEHINLRRRLKSIFSEVPQNLTSGLFGQLNAKERDRLFTRITNTRNWLAHGERRSKYRLLITDNGELDLYANKLNILVQYFVHCELGIDPHLIVDRLLSFEGNSGSMHR